MLDLTVPFNDLLKLVPAPSYNYNGWRPINDIRNREILVTAEVTETVTGITLTGNDTMKMAYTKYKLKFMDICPVNYKPGLVYTGFVSYPYKEIPISKFEFFFTAAIVAI
jgi:CD109 antigen